MHVFIIQHIRWVFFGGGRCFVLALGVSHLFSKVGIHISKFTVGSDRKIPVN